MSHPDEPPAPKTEGMTTPQDLSQASDATVVVAIGRWRQDALDEAYRRHAGSVFALARRLLNDASLAEEVVRIRAGRSSSAPMPSTPSRITSATSSPPT